MLVDIDYLQIAQNILFLVNNGDRFWNLSY